jgi:hypothetical protein
MPDDRIANDDRQRVEQRAKFFIRLKAPSGSRLRRHSSKSCIAVDRRITRYNLDSTETRIFIFAAAPAEGAMDMNKWAGEQAAQRGQQQWEQWIRDNHRRAAEQTARQNNEWFQNYMKQRHQGGGSTSLAGVVIFFLVLVPLFLMFAHSGAHHFR